ncbi:DUF3267 domain-containing protein [Oceanobacillus halotolerans]|uniref:DUF3267 domain-containing protein n=1 Tax=Oceanobacillus halotolerans TaxID=2663380 RepID=UPI0013DA20CC|nr:DUF3267 domain-containing protein [Oceanobacillus halotolerans]
MQLNDKKETVVSISMLKLNVICFLLGIVLYFGIQVLHILLYGKASLTITFSGFLLFMIALILIVCIHEAIHLIGFRYIGSVPWNQLAWGVNIKLGMAYAHAKLPIKVVDMKKVLLLPLIPTGILPLVLGLVLNNPAISILGVILTIGSFGDLALYRKLLPFPNEALVIDHPTDPKFTVYV